MKKQKKKEIILNSAIDLFAINGYHNTKISDIAEKANIGKSTVYEYFSSKQSILLEIFEVKIFQFYINLQDILSEIDCAIERLTKFMEYESKNVSSSSQMFFLVLDTFVNPKYFSSSNVYMCLHKSADLRFGIVKEIIEKGISDGQFIETDPNMAASAILGTLHTYQMNIQQKHLHLLRIEGKITNTPALSSEDIEEILNILFYGIKN